jgi:hypothetical protein
LLLRRAAVVPPPALLSPFLECVAGLGQPVVLELAALVASGLEEAEVGQGGRIGPADRLSGGGHVLLGESQGQGQRRSLQLGIAGLVTRIRVSTVLAP